MSTNITLTSFVCFIVCDAGPAAHFAVFAMNLFLQYQLRISIYGSGPALTKLLDSNLPNDIHLVPFTIEGFSGEEEEEVAAQLIYSCLKQGARTVIVDIGNKFCCSITSSLEQT